MKTATNTMTPHAAAAKPKTKREQIEYDIAQANRFNGHLDFTRQKIKELKDVTHREEMALTRKKSEALQFQVAKKEIPGELLAEIVHLENEVHALYFRMVGLYDELDGVEKKDVATLEAELAKLDKKLKK